jgi:hypothetical protein
MIRIRKFLQRARPDQWLMVQAIFVLALVTLGLRFLPWLPFQRQLIGLAHRRRQVRRAHRPAAQRIAWAIQVAGRLIPLAACLPQALAAQFLFIRNGYPADLQIGAARNADGRFEAHAWVISEGGVIVGGLPDLARFVPLSPMQENR